MSGVSFKVIVYWPTVLRHIGEVNICGHASTPKNRHALVAGCVHAGEGGMWFLVSDQRGKHSLWTTNEHGQGVKWVAEDYAVADYAERREQAVAATEYVSGTGWQDWEHDDIKAKREADEAYNAEAVRQLKKAR